MHPSTRPARRRTLPFLLSLAALSAGLVGLPAHVHANAHASMDVNTRTVAEGETEWCEASAVIRAPRHLVRAWLVDYDRWPQLFGDIESARVLGRTSDGATMVRFHSRIAGRTMVLREWLTDYGLKYEGTGTNIETRGRIHLVDQGDGTTKVTVLTTSDVRGFIGIFATRRLKRDRAFAALRSQLESLHALAMAQTAPPPGARGRKYADR